MDNQFRFNISFIPYGVTPSPVKYVEAKHNVDSTCATIFQEVLRRRTYYDAQVEQRPYVDEYETSDARMYLQCAFMCVVHEEYNEALNWYEMAHKVFCGDQPASVSTTNGDVSMTGQNGEWQVWMNADIVTKFGNTTWSIQIADIITDGWKPNNYTTTVEARMEELRYGPDGWFAHLEKSRRAVAQQKIDAKGIDYTYNEEGKTK
ncbi:MAG: hypothetical protein ACRCWC_14105 [Plesiomonas shigelloides]